MKNIKCEQTEEDSLARQIAIVLGWNISEMSLQDIQDILYEQYKINYKKMEKGCVLLAEAGWTLPMYLTTVETLEIIDSCSKEELDDFFLAFYSENNNKNLMALLKEIQGYKEINQWENLFKHCILAYDYNLYLVVIPSLISIIEGLMSKLMDNPDSPKVINVCKNKIDKSYDESYCRLVWLSIHSFIQHLFSGKHKFSGTRPEFINRHWILHGRDETSWKKVDAIRLFVAIHALLVGIR